jgi:hypothetical protein
LIPYTVPSVNAFIYAFSHQNSSPAGRPSVSHIRSIKTAGILPSRIAGLILFWPLIRPCFASAAKAGAGSCSPKTSRRGRTIAGVRGTWLRPHSSRCGIVRKDKHGGHKADSFA